MGLLVIPAWGGMSPAGQEGNEYVQELLQAARRQNLHQSRYWKILLHYRRGLAGWESLIDDPRFFLAPDGKTDPWAEMAATLQALAAPARETGEDADAPHCRFIARYAWLKEVLAIDENRLPIPNCRPFADVIAELDPRAAFLVFPTIYMNSPASMFGHTLLNIETGYPSKLLSRAVNYSARTAETNGLFFAVNGLLGFYQGFYSVMPYYQKIEQYSDIHQRDIWEYELNFSREELVRMLMHLWEVRDIFAYYYFFDENCSYNLLFLLEAGRPGLRLVDRFPYWVMPIDTIKAMVAEGLIGKVTYRPSKATRIKHRMGLMDEAHQQAALEIARGESDPQAIAAGSGLQVAERMKILDLAVDCIRYHYVKHDLGKERYRELLLGTLKARSRLGPPAGDTAAGIPAPPRPDTAHESALLRWGIGERNHETFVELGFRPAFTDLLDADYSFGQGAQIEFADTRARYYPNDGRLELERLDIIDIVSLAPRDRFFKPVSWMVRTGLAQEMTDDGEHHLVYELVTGGGFAWNHPLTGISYLLLETEGEAGDDLKRGYALGAGFAGGFIKRVTPTWIWHLRGRMIFFGPGDRHQEAEIALEQSLKVARDHAVFASGSWHESFGRSFSEWQLGWRFFF